MTPEEKARQQIDARLATCGWAVQTMGRVLTCDASDRDCDHNAPIPSIGPADFDCAPFSQRGGLGEAHQLYGETLAALLDGLNTVLAA